MFRVRALLGGGCWGEVGRLRRGEDLGADGGGNERAVEGGGGGGKEEVEGQIEGAMKAGERWFGCGTGDPRNESKKPHSASR